VKGTAPGNGLTASWSRAGGRILIERLEAGGEDAIDAGADEALPTGPMTPTTL